MIGIRSCTRCDLFKNQLPLVQSRIAVVDAFVVGISAVATAKPEADEPLSPLTPSGKLIRSIAEGASEISVYYTNVVKCLPLQSGRIRYPTLDERRACFPNLLLELAELQPRKLILLGKQVAEFVVTQLNLDPPKSVGNGFRLTSNASLTVLCAPHPSYILIYRRKQVDEYSRTLSNFLSEALPLDQADPLRQAA